MTVQQIKPVPSGSHGCTNSPFAGHSSGAKPGKAIALKTGAAAAKSEYLVCIDGDALLDRDAAAYIVEPMLYNPRVGAVTGNPRIRTRSTPWVKFRLASIPQLLV